MADESVAGLCGVVTDSNVIDCCVVDFFICQFIAVSRQCHGHFGFACRKSEANPRTRPSRWEANRCTVSVFPKCVHLSVRQSTVSPGSFSVRHLTGCLWRGYALVRGIFCKIVELMTQLSCNEGIYL